MAIARAHLHAVSPPSNDFGGLISKTIGSGMLCLNDANIVK